MTENAALKNPLQGLDLNRQLTAIGSAVLAVLSFMSWYKASVKLGGQLLHSSSSAGIDSWNGWMALIFALLTLAWMFVPTLKAAVGPKLPPPLGEWMPVLLPALAFILGPVIYFFRSSTDTPAGPMAEVSVGRTFFFWLALVAGLVATAGAFFTKSGKALSIGPRAKS